MKPIEFFKERLQELNNLIIKFNDAVKDKELFEALQKTPESQMLFNALGLAQKALVREQMTFTLLTMGFMKIMTTRGSITFEDMIKTFKNVADLLDITDLKKKGMELAEYCKSLPEIDFDSFPLDNFDNTTFEQFEKSDSEVPKSQNLEDLLANFGIKTGGLKDEKDKEDKNTKTDDV